MKNALILRRFSFIKSTILSTLLLVMLSCHYSFSAVTQFSNDNSSNYPSHSLGLGLGHVMLMGNFSDVGANDLGFNLFYEYKTSEVFSLLIDYGYSKHIANNHQNELIIKSLSPNLKIIFNEIDNLSIFGAGGFGFYHINRTTAPYAGSITGFGLNLGPGFDLTLNDHFKFGTWITLHSVFDKNDPDAKGPNGKTDMTIGGSYIRLFLSASYIF
jgi:hypothetical protein